MYFLVLALIACLWSSPAQAQALYEVSKAAREIQVDGRLDDWQGVPVLDLKPGSSGIQVTGSLDPEDLSADLRAVWTDEGLYVGLRWQDNRWDVREVVRREAVWISPDKRRRDRMLFFDNFKLQIRNAEYDYLIWVSPRIDDQGPFTWNRLLQGLRGMEMATASPMIYPRQNGNESIVEILFSWREMRIKPKRGETLPVTLVVADSDTPGRLLEAKLSDLKWVEWTGGWRLAQ